MNRFYAKTNKFCIYAEIGKWSTWLTRKVRATCVCHTETPAQFLNTSNLLWSVRASAETVYFNLDAAWDSLLLLLLLLLPLLSSLVQLISLLLLIFQICSEISEKWQMRLRARKKIRQKKTTTTKAHKHTHIFIYIYVYVCYL